VGGGAGGCNAGQQTLFGERGNQLVATELVIYMNVLTEGFFFFWYFLIPGPLHNFLDLVCCD